MFCIKCGNKLKQSDKFCTECAFPTGEYIPVGNKDLVTIEQKWWYRLAKVVYIALHIPIILVALIVWEDNYPSSYYSSYSQEYNYYWSYWESFWYTFLSVFIWLIILRLIKIWFLYIAFWLKPIWYREFRKIF